MYWRRRPGRSSRSPSPLPSRVVLAHDVVARSVRSEGVSGVVAG
jgi:hypothetical protein